MKPHLPNVTLLCADTTDKAMLASRAIEKSLEQATFSAVKLLTHIDVPHAVKIDRIVGIEGYSNFCIRDLYRHFDTSHVLVIQGDGYVLNGGAWTDEFLQYDYIGAPWQQWQKVGNGGFSLRSKKLCTLLAQHPFGDQPHPEDNYICWRHKSQLEQMGIKFCPLPLANQFAFEGRDWDGVQWESSPIHWAGQFGFHSYLTPLKDPIDRPLVFHHSGDTGDVVYGLAAMKAAGGGVIYFSGDNRFPFPRQTQAQDRNEWHKFGANLRGLCEAQDYCWSAHVCGRLPYSTDLDLNAFRRPFLGHGQGTWKGGLPSLYRMHLDAFGLDWPEDKPWLTVRNKRAVAPIVVNRTPRYHNEKFPWRQLVMKHGKDMVFVGSENEWQNFRGWGAPEYNIPWCQTNSLGEAAEVIAGAKVFVGNQSSPMAVAMGLGIPVVQETWPQGANCKLQRPHALYCDRDHAEIPDSWLV